MKALHVIAWIVFIGLCIKAGAIIISFMVSLFVNPAASADLYLGMDLSGLMTADQGHYIGMVIAIILLAIAKAWIFYLMIKIFMKTNIMQPFTKPISNLISGISYLALSIGIFAVFIQMYSEWLVKSGLASVDWVNPTGNGGAFLLLAAVVFMIAEIYKKGVDIQLENELTV